MSGGGDVGCVICILVMVWISMGAIVSVGQAITIGLSPPCLEVSRVGFEIRNVQLSIQHNDLTELLTISYVGNVTTTKRHGIDVWLYIYFEGTYSTYGEIGKIRTNPRFNRTVQIRLRRHESGFWRERAPVYRGALAKLVAYEENTPRPCELGSLMFTIPNTYMIT